MDLGVIVWCVVAIFFINIFSILFCNLVMNIRGWNRGWNRGWITNERICSLNHTARGMFPFKSIYFLCLCVIWIDEQLGNSINTQRVQNLGCDKCQTNVKWRVFKAWCGLIVRKSSFNWGVNCDCRFIYFLILLLILLLLICQNYPNVNKWKYNLQIFSTNWSKFTRSD